MQEKSRGGVYNYYITQFSSRETETAGVDGKSHLSDLAVWLKTYYDLHILWKVGW